jgi:hypothetical protein
MTMHEKDIERIGKTIACGIVLQQRGRRVSQQQAATLKPMAHDETSQPSRVRKHRQAFLEPAPAFNLGPQAMDKAR